MSWVENEPVVSRLRLNGQSIGGFDRIDNPPCIVFCVPRDPDAG